MESGNLYDTLVTYSESDFYPYHMPGHKRRQNIGAVSDIFKIDITEIDGFDNLHQPEGIILKAQEKAADLYGADESFFLINGSTCGILAAILAVTDRADSILIARNCHKSVYNAAFLKELNLKYIYPGYIEEYDIHDAVNPEAVEKALTDYPECKAVVITSPTYEGVISDIAEIAGIVHAKGKILIVDEAHGAHLGLSDIVHENAVRQGADLVIHSLHKTLPSMTQTALLHVSGSYVNRTKLRRYLSILQSSSPSYVMMASIDSCISYLKSLKNLKENISDEFIKLSQNYQNFIKKIENCRHIHVLRPELLNGKQYSFTAMDICKLVISVKGSSISGQMLYNILRDDFHLQMELSAETYVLAIMTIADEQEAWKRLADAIIQIDGSIESVRIDSVRLKSARNVRIKSSDTEIKSPNAYHKPETVMNIAKALEAVDTEAEEILLEQAQGKISGGFINLYPPGIPILVPGEVIDKGIIEQIEHYLKLGLNVQGISQGKIIIVNK